MSVSQTARAALLAAAITLLVLGAIAAIRYAAQLPSFLPHVTASEVSWTQIGQILLALGLVLGGFGTPIFLLIRRNGELAAAKRSIHDREAEFRAYASAGSDWLWATDSRGRLTSVVGGRWQTPEGRHDGSIGRTLDQLVGSGALLADTARWRKFREDVTARRPFRNFEVTVTDPKGRQRHLSLSAVPTYDEAGAFAGYRGATTDITARKDAETALRDSRQRFQDFASSASDWFWETDEEHRFSFNSDRIGDTLGVRPSYATGKSRFELVSEADQAARPDAWRQHRDDLDNRRPFRNFEYESIINGERRTILTSGVPVFDADGRFTGYRGSAADVTEVRRTEREALEYLRQFRVLADNLPILIANFDADWRFLYVNHTAEVWFNRPREEILGRTYEEVVGQELGLSSMPTRERVLRGETVRHEKETLYPDGKTRTVQRTLLPDMRPGEPIRIHVMSIDVTEQRKLEDQVRQNMKMEALGKLTGGVAHDFNNLLLAIQGNLEILRDEPVEDSLQPLVVNALRGVDRAADLTRRLLAFSRRQPLAPRVVDVGGLLSEMEPLLRRTLEAYVDLDIDTGDEPAVALIDPSQLENAILNLAINGKDAMPESGKLAVRVRVEQRTPPADEDSLDQPAKPQAYVCVEVEDAGVGMPDDVREHAFEPFFTTKEVGHGTGLGLSMVHGFVTQSGGFAEIDTEPGRGTRMRLYLPPADEAETHRPPATALARPVGGGTALLVEDNEMVRAVAERHLSDLGYEVVTASAAGEAEAVLSGPRSIDLLVTDLVIGGPVDGFDLAERARRRWPDLGVVVMTGRADLLGNRAEADRHDVRLIAKPFSRSALAETIAAAVSPANSEPAATLPLRAAG